jgi:hypothetical protein
LPLLLRVAFVGASVVVALMTVSFRSALGAFPLGA